MALIWSIIQGLGIAFWVRPYVFDWNAQFVIEMTTGFDHGFYATRCGISEQITEKGSW
jgi:hypothetical protein